MPTLTSFTSRCSRSGERVAWLGRSWGNTPLCYATYLLRWRSHFSAQRCYMAEIDQSQSLDSFPPAIPSCALRSRVEVIFRQPFPPPTLRKTLLSPSPLNLAHVRGERGEGRGEETGRSNSKTRWYTGYAREKRPVYDAKSKEVSRFITPRKKQRACILYNHTYLRRALPPAIWAIPRKQR